MLERLMIKRDTDESTPAANEPIYEVPAPLVPPRSKEGIREQLNLSVYTEDYLKQQIIEFISRMTHKGGKYLLCYYMFHNINKYIGKILYLNFDSPHFSFEISTIK